MKVFFLALLFINIAYFMWAWPQHDQRDSLPNVEKVMSQSGIETLTVVPLSRIETSVMSDQSQSGKECFKAGLFQTLAQAERFTTSLGVKVSRFSIDADQSQNEFWLILPAEATWELSQEREKSLKTRGINDVWLVPNGEEKGVVSLGLFKRETRARNRLDELHAQGIEAEIRKRSLQRYVVRWEQNSDKSQDAQWHEQESHASKITIQKIAC